MEGVRFVERKNAEGEVEKIVIGRTGEIKLLINLEL